MDAGVVVGMLGAAVAAIFGAWNLSIGKQSAILEKYADAWKELYEKESDKHDKTRARSAEDIRELTGAVKDLTQVVQRLPKRADDWSPEHSQRGLT